jgi:hypothetical protein
MEGEGIVSVHWSVCATPREQTNRNEIEIAVSDSESDSDSQMKCNESEE